MTKVNCHYCETFPTSLKLLNRIQWYFTGSKISASSNKFGFFGPIGKMMIAPASDWLRHFRLLWNQWTEFNETCLEAKSQRLLPSLCFSGRSKKKTKMAHPAMIGWDIFDFSFETAEWNSMKFYRKQDLNVLREVCVFSDRSDKQDGRPGLWLAETFLLLLWNRGEKLNETWQDARCQCPLPSLCFSGRSEKQDGATGFWFAELFSTSSLKLLNRIKRNFTGSKISMSSNNFGFFGPIGKTRWPPMPLIRRVIFHFSSKTAEQNSTKHVRKKNLDVLYQVCVFRAVWKN